MYFALVDDEPGALIQIPKYIKQILSDDTTIDCYQNPIDFLEKFSQKCYDAIFLDIDMPKITGFEISEKLENTLPIVYITARDDLIIHAFRYRAIGFVRKKYLSEELPFAIDTIINELKKSNDIIEIKELRSMGGKTYNISIHQILYIESIRNNSNIYLENNQTIITRNKVSYYFEHLGFENFVFINQGIIVNLDKIEIDNDKIIFSNGKNLYVSRRKIKPVTESYMKRKRKLLI